MLLHDTIKHWNDITPDKIAVIANDNFFTYQELWSNAKNIASWVGTNAKPFSRIAILLENNPETIFAIYGVTLAGGICVPLDTDIHERNLTYILNDCSIETIITSTKNLNKISEANKDILSNIILVDNTESYLDFDKILANNATPNFTFTGYNETLPAFILYTTGTTGPQKGVILSHYNLLEATRNINEFMQIDSSIIESLPMRLSHSFGFARLRSVFEVGGTVILENGLLRPERVIFNMKKHKANAFSCVPSGLAIILDHYQNYFKEICNNIKHIEIGSAFMRKNHKDLLMNLCPKARICMHYGLTEASRATFLEFHSEKEKIMTIGKPSPNVQIKIVDEKDNDLGITKQGNLLVKGNMVTNGYLNKDQQTKQTIKNGWLNTGDIGMIDEDGYIHLLGRKKEIINVGGLKVAPGEIEEVLLKHLDIIEVGVIGEPSDDLNMEAICAFIVTENPEINIQDIRNFCMDKLEIYKIPKKLVLVESLPKTSSGKIQRHLLKKINDKKNGE